MSNEVKSYPRRGMTAVSMSTIVYCAKCKQPSDIYEAVYKVDDREVFYHVDCVSDDTKSAETKVVELQLSDDLNVKSEGR